jgi:3-phosphoshikimate 1-carboxyvinyltransferase
MRHVPPAAGPLRGALRVPGDKSVSHRCALLAPLAEGDCTARAWLDAEDTGRSLAAVAALGALVERDGDAIRVARGAFPGPGDGADRPEIPVDCGNSGTTARLLLGLLAGRRVCAVLDGDASLRSRPMARVVEPLRRIGARLEYLGEAGRLPIRVTGAPLRGAEHVLPVASAQLKSALLLAGLCADGPTVVRGGGASRDHTERFLHLMGADLRGDAAADAWTLTPGAPLAAFDLDVPADPSSAAFPLAAAALVPGSAVTVRSVLLNPTRTGFLRVLARMGADLEVVNADASAEPAGDLVLRHAPLHGVEIGGEEIPTLIDELPVLAVLAARAAGRTVVRDAAELRVKESDRIAATVEGLRSLGIRAESRPDGFEILGSPERFPASVRPSIRTFGDHRIAMAFAVAALASRAGVDLDDDACVAVSYPGFFADCERLQSG